MARESGVEQPKPAAQAAAEAVPETKGGEVEVDLTPLTYLGVPKSVLETVPKSVLQEWSTQAKERETKRATDIQQRSEELKQLRDELGRFKSQPVQATTKAEPAKPTAQADLDSELKSVVDELRDLGVPAGEKLASVLKAREAAANARVEGLETVNQRLATEVGEFFIEQARSKLEVQYPQLSDDAVFTRVRDEAELQVATGRYKEMPYRKAIAAAIDTAAKLVLFDDIVKAQTEKVQSQHRERIAGQPTAPSRQPEARPMSPEERDDKIAELLMAGKTEDAKRLARG